MGKNQIILNSTFRYFSPPQNAEVKIELSYYVDKKAGIQVIREELI